MDEQTDNGSTAQPAEVVDAADPAVSVTQEAELPAVPAAQETESPAVPAAQEAVSAAPTPGPRKPGPVRKPGPATARPHPTAPARVVSDPSAYGRVDDDGVVWLKTADGERAIANWQAGTPAEGLAHYGRRYDDLAAEVALLEARLESQTGDPAATRKAATALATSLPEAAVIGDVAALAAKLGAIVTAAETATTQAKLDREAGRLAAIERKETLAAEAETIAADSTAWKVSGERLRAIVDEWKTIKGIDRKTDDALWKRYVKARDAFNKRRGAHFAELDRERAGAKAKKEDLITRAREITAATDWTTLDAGDAAWNDTARTLRDLLAEWKKSGRAPRDQDDALWQQFKAAQDVFYGARNAASSARDEEFSANAEQKKTLLAAAEKSVDPANLSQARKAFREFRDKWEAIGKVPREQVHTLEKRFAAVEARVKNAEQDQWRRTDPEAVARAEQFATRAAELRAQADKAAAAGKAKDAAKLGEQATQWEQWAQAAKDAVSSR